MSNKQVKIDLPKYTRTGSYTRPDAVNNSAPSQQTLAPNNLFNSILQNNSSGEVVAAQFGTANSRNASLQQSFGGKQESFGQNAQATRQAQYKQSSIVGADFLRKPSFGAGLGPSGVAAHEHDIEHHYGARTPPFPDQLGPSNISDFLLHKHSLKPGDYSVLQATQPPAFNTRSFSRQSSIQK